MPLLSACLGENGERRDTTAGCLTLAAAVDEARAGNADVAASRASSDAAAARPATERFLMPPMIEVQAFQWPLNTANPANAQLMFTVEQQLPGPGKRALRVARAQREAEIAVNAVAMQQVRVTSDVKDAYVSLWAARAALALLRGSADLARALGAAAEVKYAAGGTSQQEVVRGLVERTRVEQESVMAREQARLAEVRLTALLGRDPGSPIGALAPPDVPPLPPETVVMDAAIHHQPELRGLSLEAAVAEADAAVARSERRPDFVVQGGYMTMPGMTDAWTARAGVTWPNAPWSRGRIDALAREAEARRDAARARQRALLVQVGQTVRESYVRARAAEERAVLIRDSLLPQAQYAFDLARLAYETNRATFLDLVDAERMTVDLQRDLVRAHADRLLAVAAIERATGAPLIESVTATSGASR